MLRERTAGPAIWDALSKNIPKREHPHRDLSTALRSGRDDKGKGGASGKSSCWTETPHERESIHTEISPLRYAPVEMTKGKVALPGRAVAGLKHPMSESIHTEISPLRCAPVEMTKGKVALPGRAVAGLKHSQERTAGPQISPLRCAPVEMTKGRVTLPG